MLTNIPRRDGTLLFQSFAIYCNNLPLNNSTNYMLFCYTHSHRNFWNMKVGSWFYLKYREINDQWWDPIAPGVWTDVMIYILVLNLWTTLSFGNNNHCDCPQPNLDHKALQKKIPFLHHPGLHQILQPMFP